MLEQKVCEHLLGFVGIVGTKFEKVSEIGLWCTLKSRLRILKLILYCRCGQLWKVSGGEINLIKVVFQEDWQKNDTWEIWVREPTVRFLQGRA